MENIVLQSFRIMYTDVLRTGERVTIVSNTTPQTKCMNNDTNERVILTPTIH